MTKARDRLIELLDSRCYEALSKCKGENKDKKLCEFLADYLLANGVIVSPAQASDTILNANNVIICKNCKFFVDDPNARKFNLVGEGYDGLCVLKNGTIIILIV